MSCIKAAAWLTAVGLTCSWLAGCTTTNDQSDVPWNVPQSWEGSVPMPGSQ